jgi:hypothetical protein
MESATAGQTRRSDSAAEDKQRKTYEKLPCHQSSPERLRLFLSRFNMLGRGP